MADEFGGEFIGLPEYFVTNVRTEVIEGCPDSIRAFHWAKRGGLMCPLFTTVLSAASLITIGERIRNHAVIVLNPPIGCIKH